MSIELENKQGLIAGDGELPVELAKSARENGFEVVCISLSADNKNELKKEILKDESRVHIGIYIIYK